jgi:hypothetical protein
MDTLETTSEVKEVKSVDKIQRDLLLLKAQLMEREQELTELTKEDFRKKFEVAIEAFEQIPSDARECLFSESEFSGLLSKLRLDYNCTKAPNTKKYVPPNASIRTISDEQILSFLSTEKNITEVARKFGFSPATSAKRLNDLFMANQVNVRDEGISKYFIRI